MRLFDNSVQCHDLSRVASAGGGDRGLTLLAVAADGL